ncbi:MAG: nitrilase family protein [Duncaniella sp.]|nr:nitrilase family protein [Duncaniella sp.]
MSNILKVCTLAHDIIAGSVHENIISVASRLREVEPDTDLVILPELFTTGYVFDREALASMAETDDGHTVDTLRRWAQFFGVALAGSFLATDGEGRYFNRGFFIEPGGDTTLYDKRHLFTLSGEHEIYTCGHTPPPVVRYRGWNIRLIICYDLRFPVWLRTTPRADYDLLICPAMWGGARSHQFKTLMAARAIENQAYAISCNRLGKDAYGTYPAGMSVCFDCLGNEIHETRRNGLVYALLELELLRRAREKFPVADAADEFTIVY